jgi:hypothetical protein
MSTNPQQSPYLRNQRSFPTDNIQALTVEIDRSYVDIAQKVNSRTIGLFGLNTSMVTGEQWFLNGQPTPQQTLRKLLTFTSSGSIPLGVNLSQISGIVKIYGTFTDGTNWYTLPWVDVLNATNQVNVYVAPATPPTYSNVIITSGGGSPPAIVSGFVVVEWLANV